MRRLLVSDLDGTLLGDAAALVRFSRWIAARRDRFHLVYASGRDPESIRGAVADGLPRPDALIASVGTRVIDGDGRPVAEWHGRFDPEHGDRARAALRGIPWLELQPPDAQTDLKASYYVYGLGPTDEATVRAALAEAGIEARLVYSHGLDLDVIPAGAGKGPAARFLADRLGIAPDDVLAFGDSGNDVDLLSAGFRSTIVGNALRDLASAVGQDVYRSPRSFADGVLDGIEHWAAAD